jgi:hypothetical protein
MKIATVIPEEGVHRRLLLKLVLSVIAIGMPGNRGDGLRIKNGWILREDDS